MGIAYVCVCLPNNNSGVLRWKWGCVLGSITLHDLFIVIQPPDIARGDQHGGSRVNWKNTKIWISLPILSKLFLNYACTLDILIHQYVHKNISDGTLLILLNFWKTWFKFISLPAIRRSDPPWLLDPDVVQHNVDSARLFTGSKEEISMW